MTLATYLIYLIAGSAIIYVLRTTKFSIPTQLEQNWKFLAIGWCIGITILYIWERLSDGGG